MVAKLEIVMTDAMLIWHGMTQTLHWSVITIFKGFNVSSSAINQALHHLKTSQPATDECLHNRHGRMKDRYTVTENTNISPGVPVSKRNSAPWILQCSVVILHPECCINHASEPIISQRWRRTIRWLGSLGMHKPGSLDVSCYLSIVYLMRFKRFYKESYINAHL